MQPQFLYFDMGNVLLWFSHERMAEQMAAVSGTTAPTAWKILFEDGLHWAYERGEFARQEFYERFCRAAGVKLVDIDRLDAAGSDIFEVNALLVGLAGRLAGAGYRLGILSNTTESHWGHCKRRFGSLETVFSVYALSYRLGAMKPSPAIYEVAAKLAGAPTSRIFFTDDRMDNVEAALSAGMDAVLYESVSQLNEALRQRGVKTNF
jgi:putative hydrolase of the HAD superfamily